MAKYSLQDALRNISPDEMSSITAAHNRRMVFALAPQITALHQRGYSIRQIHYALTKAGKITSCYAAFVKQCKKVMKVATDEKC